MFNIRKMYAIIVFKFAAPFVMHNTKLFSC